MRLPWKRFPAPVARPMAPFLAASLIVLYGVNSLQNAMMNSEEFRNDPRNPNRQVKSAEKH
ncbi:atp18 subunit J of the mitochondrial F1F0 ATP synthase [Ophidiomyces ophidiicola]|nr:atp18 subunit J of the mitochondrial F1F0 ATP synthase [Ophidiomyces ophidiicola]KAI2094993.1 atp18 subunit J of the mitochondrial F1F0 ATP synthase [Ophidiomyces ophidiicola]KAI2361354.1 atp18 subunit J of the mitochondrial F1F0 ATP synthase [Ophidiomyces ophidiicola]KAI2375611.1 atp18 subunit J of the mitochondrial F1F0 ATP synthase [Ophidiomyces ophidiicola]KAI2425128.1 atp18 subunit J of the mitochondrial F1F0 ATP synthase [Ophidiomyces ophidiicola]